MRAPHTKISRANQFAANWPQMQKNRYLLKDRRTLFVVFNHFNLLLTLGTWDFSSAFPGFFQVFTVTRAKNGDGKNCTDSPWTRRGGDTQQMFIQEGSRPSYGVPPSPIGSVNKNGKVKSAVFHIYARTQTVQKDGVRRISLALLPLLVRWEQAGPANNRVYRCREAR